MRYGALPKNLHTLLDVPDQVVVQVKSITTSFDLANRKEGIIFNIHSRVSSLLDHFDPYKDGLELGLQNCSIPQSQRETEEEGTIIISQDASHRGLRSYVSYHNIAVQFPRVSRG